MGREPRQSYARDRAVEALQQLGHATEHSGSRLRLAIAAWATGLVLVGAGVAATQAWDREKLGVALFVGGLVLLVGFWGYTVRNRAGRRVFVVAPQSGDPFLVESGSGGDAGSFGAGDGAGGGGGGDGGGGGGGGG